MPANRKSKIVLGIVLVILVVALFWLWQKNTKLAQEVLLNKQEMENKIKESNKKAEREYAQKSNDNITGKMEINSDLSAINIQANTLNIKAINSTDINNSDKIITKELAAVYINTDIINSDYITTSIININGGGSISCSNCLALGTATTGNYVAGVVAGTDINIIGSSGEGSLPIVYNVSTLQSVTDRGATTTNALTINATGDSLTLNGDGTIRIAQTLGPTTPTDRLYNVGGSLVWNGVNLSGVGPMPIGASGQTMRHDGANWLASSLLFNNGTNIGIGDTSPLALLTVGSGDLFQVNSSGAVAAAAGITSSGTITFSGLTASRLLSTNGSSALTSVSALSSWIAGTANQIIVTNNGSGGVTLSAPQNLGTGNSPSFTGLTLSGLTPGSVIFVGAGGIISQNNANFFWDNATNRLGLGTNLPSQRLHLGSGNILMPATDGPDNGNIFLGGNTYSGDNAMRIGYTNGYLGLMDVKTNNTTNGLLFRVDTTNGWTERMRITGGGNVGINESNPLHRLQITDADTTASRAGVYVSQTGVIVGTGYGLYVIKTGGSTTNVGGYFSATGATNNYGLIVANGYAGIGTTTPGAKLDVLTSAAVIGLNIKAADTSTALQTWTTSGGAVGLQVKDDGTGVLRLAFKTDASVYLEPLLGTVIGSNAIIYSDLGFNTDAAAATGAYIAAQTGDVGIRWRVIHSGTLEWGDGGSSSGDTNLYRVAANKLGTDDTLYVGGDVGIGDASPSHKLQIADSDTTAGRAAARISQTGVIVGTGYGLYVTKTGGSTTNVGGYFSASGATHNYGLIVAAGDVGIGTTTPGTKLDVNGFITWNGQKRVSTQYDKTTNTTLNSITGLVADVEAGKTYYFEAILFVDADVTGGSKYQIGGTATATAITYQVQLVDDSTDVLTINSRITDLGTSSAGQAGTTAGVCRIFGTITVNAAGTLASKFAQNVSNGTSSVLVGSTFIVNEIK